MFGVDKHLCFLVGFFCFFFSDKEGYPGFGVEDHDSSGPIGVERFGEVELARAHGGGTVICFEKVFD